MELNKKKVVYICDPEKNHECTKERCFLNGGPCRCTAFTDFAKTGEKSKPIVALATDYCTDQFP
jgi:hypothetical protein